MKKQFFTILMAISLMAASSIAMEKGDNIPAEEAVKKHVIKEKYKEFHENSKAENNQFKAQISVLEKQRDNIITAPDFNASGFATINNEIRALKAKIVQNRDRAHLEMFQAMNHEERLAWYKMKHQSKMKSRTKMQHYGKRHHSGPHHKMGGANKPAY
jgi:hypothetical protein